jgi:uncharacterized protein (TIGR02246 family)
MTEQRAAETTPESSKNEAAVRELVTTAYMAKVNAHDANGYANELYADDVLWSAPDQPDQNSKAGIRTFIGGLFEKLSFDVELTVSELEVMGDFAYAIGNVEQKLTPRAGGDLIRARLRIMWLLRKQPDGWRIHRQIWNKKPLAG